MSSQLEQLRSMTTIVADTGDFGAIKEYQPIDATTNPSLVFQAAQKPEYRDLIKEAIREANKGKTHDERRSLLIDNLFVNFGIKLLEIVPGRVSTEVDATLSFDTQGSIDRAKHIISLYERNGIPRERVLIKLATTWEGVRAAEVLEMEGIHCNMTLIFSLAQAAACMAAKATLISPFVGRVLDWYKKETGTTYTGETDPGVILVRGIYNYGKKFGYKTEIMGASFRNKDEIVALAGCDLLTISPKLLDELHQCPSEAPQKLSKETASAADLKKLSLSEPIFRYLFNKDAMAVEKLADGIRNFANDTDKLEAFIAKEFEWKA